MFGTFPCNSRNYLVVSLSLRFLRCIMENYDGLFEKVMDNSDFDI